MPLQPIGEFASAVGLSQSALRQYGERGLLAPVEVEERSGYRYYAPEQQQRAIWIRRLRDAGLRLDTIQVVLGSDESAATIALDEWVADVEERSASVVALANDVRLSIEGRARRNPSRRTVISIDAAVLRSAVEQVANMTKASDVLLETSDRSLAVVATDSYLLVARTDLPAEVKGAHARVSIAPSHVSEWLRGCRRIHLVVDTPIGRDGSDFRQRAWLHDENGGDLELTAVTDRFPDARRIIQAAEVNSNRVSFRREDLNAITSDSAAAVQFHHRRGATFASVGSEVVRGEAAGPFTTFSMSASVLQRITKFGLGETLICEVGEPGHPLVWRTPAQPDFVALAMPFFA